MMKWIYHGRCWRFGDNLGIDGAIMPLRFALSRETDPTVLRDFLMSEIDPDFAKKVKPGDIIVGGRRFGQGNPHIQGFLGIRGHDLGLVAESIPRGSFRNVINAGVPFLAPCPDVTKTCETGDELEVNFATGSFRNLTRGEHHQYMPIEPELRDIIAIGGWEGHVKNRLRKAGSA
jgi:3-isopropylmalate/(R)-2-methylmalate dehydratase small subunit